MQTYLVEPLVGESAKYYRQLSVINSSVLNLDAGFGCDLIVASKRIFEKISNSKKFEKLEGI